MTSTTTYRTARTWKSSALKVRLLQQEDSTSSTSDYAKRIRRCLTPTMPPGLPLEREIEHEFIAKPGAQPSNRATFRLVMMP